MSDQTFTMEIQGLEELNQALSNLGRNYPDQAEQLLIKSARAFRNDVVKEVKNITSTNGKNPKSLAKASSYKISPVKDFGVNQFVEISAKSPHFHLVEHGHDLVKNGKKIGFVQGKHMMRNISEKYKNDMPKRVKKMMRKMLEREGVL